jgi:hypothetical protein
MSAEAHLRGLAACPSKLGRKPVRSWQAANDLVTICHSNGLYTRTGRATSREVVVPNARALHKSGEMILFPRKMRGR